MDKQILREKYRKIRSQLASDVRKKKSVQICEKLLLTDAFKNADTVLCYSAIASEVDTADIIEQLFSQKKTVLLPVCDEEDGIMHASRLEAPQKTDTGKFEIGEPTDKTPFTEKIDLVLVPGIAFDKKGYRIGYGKGYYDRFLKTCTDAVFIGLCYSECLASEGISADKHDIATDLIITDTEVIDGQR